MESKLVKIKTDFNNIITVRTTVKNIFDILQIRIDKLKILYAEFIKTSKNQMFVFGLDSFNFQSKLIDIEYDDMKRLFLAINNRMYCEYFKLYKIIIDYISVNINDKKITEIVKTNNYPVYKDLEPFKEYKFETILDIHENILNLLGILISTLNNKENELLLHKNKQSIGLNIDNFITTFNYSIIVMREKIIMFITYIEFFHKLHTKYLKRFANKIQLMYSHINNDIQFDESVDINKKGIDDSDSSNYENEPFKSSNRNDSDRNDSISSSNDSISSNNNSNNSNNDSINSNNDSINNNNDSNTNDTSKLNVSSSNNIIIMDPLEILITGPSNDNMSDRSKTDSIVSNISTPRFKLKNVVKTMNNFMVLSNNNHEEHKGIEGTLSHDDLNDMFSTIDMSCDSIINNEKHHLENISEPENIINETLIEPVSSAENITLSIQPQTIYPVLDEPMPPVENENSDDLSISEASQLTMDEADQPKKKRAYKPRKKKNSL